MNITEQQISSQVWRQNSEAGITAINENNHR